MSYIRLRGIGASPGVAQGEVQLKERIVFTSRKDIIPQNLVKSELKRLDNAIKRTQKQILTIRDEIKEKIGTEHSFIFEAHLLILEDKSLLASLKAIIQEETAKAEWAISCIHKKYHEIFESIEDEYFSERGSDVSDVLSKVYLNLESAQKIKKEDQDSNVLVAHDLLPSDAAMSLSQGNVLAVALDVGGPTSHTAILARSMNIPAVVGLRDISKKVKDGDQVIVDGTAGEVIINPAIAVEKEFVGKKRKYDDYQKELRKTARLSSETLDGFEFCPLANIELPEEVSQAFSLGAEGIGLFRSEFIYLQSTSLPSEEEHLQIYSKLAKKAHPALVDIRTVDIGGEKNLPQMKIEKEPNPALGLRAIRLSLRDKDLFNIQLRAILKASTLKNIRILIPMITEAEEIQEVKFILENVKSELREQGVPFDENIPLGIMIEVPAAAAITDVLVKEVDYLSIGTNDLIQYYLAVDRTNELVSYLFKPLHPSVLRLVRFVIKTAGEHGKDVSVCGEMAADPLSALVLLGFGLRRFSMNPIFIPRIKKALRSVEYKTVCKIVQNALKLGCSQEIEEHIIEKILVKHPKAFLMTTMD